VHHDKDFEGLATPIECEGRDYGNPIQQDTEINHVDLDEEFVHHTEKYAWWAFLAEHAKAEVNELKNQLEIAYAQLDHRIRDKAAKHAVEARAKKQTPIKYTEKMVENEVLLSDEYQEILTKYNNARRAAGLAAAGQASMQHRRDMLLQLGANYRTEGGSDPVILKEEAKRKAAERAAAREERESQGEPPAKRPPGRKQTA